MVRRGLVNHFDWKGHGIEVAGVFGDGASALEFVRENKVDIIVTDVRMARMDGITLAKNVLDFSPDVKIVFISGYADVDYLKDALKMKSSPDYSVYSAAKLFETFFNPRCSTWQKEAWPALLAATRQKAPKPCVK